MKGKIGWASMALIALVLALAGCSEKKEDQVNPCYGVTCSGQGLCTVKAGKAHCECYMGYKADGLECVEDEESETAEEMEEEEAEAEAETEGEKGEVVVPAPVDGGGNEAALVTVDREELLVLFEVIEGVKKLLKTNAADCEGAAKETIDFYTTRVDALKEAAGKLPAKAMDIGSKERLAESRQFMSSLELSFSELHAMMMRMKKACPEQARAIGEVMASVSICAFNPGDAKTLSCLRPESW